jgi:hypothetical protein
VPRDVEFFNVKRKLIEGWKFFSVPEKCATR